MRPMELISATAVAVMVMVRRQGGIDRQYNPRRKRLIKTRVDKNPRRETSTSKQVTSKQVTESVERAHGHVK